jgi:hypothetical protein
MVNDFQSNLELESLVLALLAAEGRVCFAGWWLTYPSEKYESQLG